MYTTWHSHKILDYVVFFFQFFSRFLSVSCFFFWGEKFYLITFICFLSLSWLNHELSMFVSMTDTVLLLLSRLCVLHYLKAVYLGLITSKSMAYLIVFVNHNHWNRPSGGAQSTSLFATMAKLQVECTKANKQRTEEEKNHPQNTTILCTVDGKWSNSYRNKRCIIITYCLVDKISCTWELLITQHVRNKNATRGFSI